jgi:hypothetical protein
MVLQELEPLPDLDCLKDVQEFHASLSASHSSRDQFLKVLIFPILFFSILFPHIHYELTYHF